MSDTPAPNSGADDTDRPDDDARRVERPWRPAPSASGTDAADRPGPTPTDPSESESAPPDARSDDGADPTAPGDAPARQPAAGETPDGEDALPDGGPPVEAEAPSQATDERTDGSPSSSAPTAPEAPPANASSGTPTSEEGSPSSGHHDGTEAAEGRTEENTPAGPDADPPGARGQGTPSPPSGDDLNPTTPDDSPGPNEPSAVTGTDESALRDGKQVNDEAFRDDGAPDAWADVLSDADDAPAAPTAPDDERSFFTDDPRRTTAERIEEEIQDAAYRRNEGRAGSAWTPSEQADRRIASMFALLVSKVAEDMSYRRTPGDEFWDPRKIMRRQIDNRPLRHCKMEYTKRRLALLVDTSPSCRDEAVFYSKIASGAMLRDDIDIFLCPNGHIEARFDPEPMRFVDDERGAEWALDGRTVLYFTDWDGADELVAHSRSCTLYWFDNRPPDNYWHSDRERHQRIRLRYRGRHFHCPDKETFRKLARKIRP